jgi:hypothetical protein
VEWEAIADRAMHEWKPLLPECFASQEDLTTNEVVTPHQGIVCVTYALKTTAYGDKIFLASPFQAVRLQHVVRRLKGLIIF